jgi:hypothetical protein
MYFPDLNSTLPRFGKPDGGELTHSYSVESGGEVKLV